MCNENNKILKYNHRKKSLKAPAIIYADLECLLEKMHSCQNNLEESYKEKKTKHTPSGYPLFTSDVKFVFWCNKKQTWLLQRWRLYGKVL